MAKFTIGLLLSLLAPALLGAAEPPLRLSVYATAGGVNRYLASEEGRDRAVEVLRRFQVSRIFLEGRRGDEYVGPEALRELRDYFGARGIRTTGAIATVPGKEFGVRQNEKLGWLNYEEEKTRREVSQFFSENAGVFDELIIDDFYCTADTSPVSDKARGERSWAQYRQDLLVSLIEPMILAPARAARPSVRLILKYPQWYDRFHLFGYDPARMSPPFDLIWVGTEVRNPQTQRMGFVQPTEGYINFRWLAAVAGEEKVRGAWFDHIECTAQNLVDQAWQSVLAGAEELTLFHLGDLMEGHAGHERLVKALPELMELSGKVRGQPVRGVAYYKPASSDAEENLYLMDYVAMLGIPVAPTARYPLNSRAAMLGVQAAGDPNLLGHMRRHLDGGATLVVTPALLRRLGRAGQRLAGVEVSEQAEPAAAKEASSGRWRVALGTPLEVDGGLRASGSRVRIEAAADGRQVPLLTVRNQGRGRLLVWNVRTFSEQDYLDTGERLLAPKPLGLPAIPQELADRLRQPLLEPLGLEVSAPAGVALYLIGNGQVLYNFHDRPVEVRLGGRTVQMEANGVLWR